MHPNMNEKPKYQLYMTTKKMNWFRKLLQKLHIKNYWKKVN